MGSDLNICANIIRFFLVIINIFFIILGLILIGVGSWLIATGDDYAFITGNSVISAAALLIIAGIATVIICATGIFGALFKLRPILFIYAIVVLIIVIFEIVAGILGFVFRDNVVSTVNSGGERAISLYTVDPDGATPEQRDATQLVDFIQNTLSCCGYNNASDWFRLNREALVSNGPPGYLTEGDGCAQCNPATDENCMTFTNASFTFNFSVTQTGCINTVSDNVIVFASVAGAIGIVFGLLEIFGIVFALILCCCITSARRQEVV